MYSSLWLQGFACFHILVFNIIYCWTRVTAMSSLFTNITFHYFPFWYKIRVCPPSWVYFLSIFSIWSFIRYQNILVSPFIPKKISLTINYGLEVFMFDGLGWINILIFSCPLPPKRGPLSHYQWTIRNLSYIQLVKHILDLIKPQKPKVVISISEDAPSIPLS